MSTQFLIGCDPEFFVREKSTGRLVSAAGLIPGDKETPHKVGDGAIQVDGLAVEFNTNPVPLGDTQAFNRTFTSVVKSLKDAVGAKYSLVIEPSVTFDKEYYDTVVPADAKVLGCDPDFNAYTGGMNTPPSADSPARGAAGHIHLGWAKDLPIDHPDHLEICRNFVKCLDLWVGVSLTCFETDTFRRTMYGASGAFRPKPYGVEYRVPSNAWCTSKARREFMVMCVNQAVADMRNGESAVWKRLTNPTGDGRYYNPFSKGVDETEIRRIIDQSDREAARKLMLSISGNSIPA